MHCARCASCKLSSELCAYHVYNRMSGSPLTPTEYNYDTKGATHHPYINQAKLACSQQNCYRGRRLRRPASLVYPKGARRALCFEKVPWDRKGFSVPARSEGFVGNETARRPAEFVGRTRLRLAGRLPSDGAQGHGAGGRRCGRASLPAGAAGARAILGCVWSAWLREWRPTSTAAADERHAGFCRRAEAPARRAGVDERAGSHAQARCAAARDGCKSPGRRAGRVFVPFSDGAAVAALCRNASGHCAVVPRIHRRFVGWRSACFSGGATRVGRATAPN